MTETTSSSSTCFRLLSQALQSDSPADCALLCETILETEPDHLPALEMKAKSLWRQGAFKEALTTIDLAIVLNPYDPGYFFLKGDCLQQMALYAPATECFRRVCNGADERLASEASARISEINTWQEQLIGELALSDAHFRNSLQRDASSTLAAHGFAHSNDVQPTVKRAVQPALFARPS